MCEQLEERQLLTVLVDGDTFTFVPPEGKQGDIVERVVVGGNPGSTQVELVGGRWDTKTGAFSLDNLPGLIQQGISPPVPVQGTVGGVPTGDPGLQPTQQQQSGGGTTQPDFYDDTIFALYVTKSDSSSFITVEQFDLKTTPPTPLAFTGSIGKLHVTARGDVTAPDGTGAALLGAVTREPDQITDVPITQGTAAPGTFTLLPSAGNITAGVTVVAGNDFGNFLFGGTVLGTMDFGASLNEYYAGWLLSDNFTVAGNLQSLISKGSIATDNASLLGGDLLYTGFSLHVGGRLGEVRTTGDFLGNVDVTGASSVPGVAGNTPGSVNEVEFFGADGFPKGLLGTDAVSNNDTFNTPEIPLVNPDGTVSVNGSLTVGPAGDNVDYYAVALMAGQTITVQLNSILTPPQQFQEPLDVGVFDPDGRLVATDYNKTDSNFTRQLPFQITTDKPGLWRFAVAETGNGLFDAAGGTITELGHFLYNLTVSNVGNVTFGGVLANGVIRDIGAATGFHAAAGDLGAVVAVGGQLGPIETPDTDTFVVDAGNLRAAQGASLGPNIVVTAAVPAGNIGLLSATSGSLTFDTDLFVPLGGSLQVLSATGAVDPFIEADGGIGVIRAGSFPKGELHVNFDHTNNHDGIIDLIDVTGDLGTLEDGGPPITTGPGGNVRYMHVGGTVYEDRFFGGGFPSATLYQQGEAVDIVDDSGTVAHITPSAGVLNPLFNPNLPGSQQYTVLPGQLTITTYGIEGSGGSAIVDINSTEGVTVTGQANNTLQTVEVGSIEANGAGTAVIQAPATPTTTGGSSLTPPPPTSTGTVFPLPGQPGGAPLPTSGKRFQEVPLAPPPILASTGEPLDVIANGNTRVDIYSITGGAFTSIQNQTSGEIVNVKATSIGNLSSNGTLGLTQNYLSEDVNGLATFSNTYPFNQQHYGIQTSGGIVSITAPKMGNIMAGADGIGTIQGGPDGPIVSGGAIQSVNFGGAGVGWAGSGDLGRTGLYAAGTIGSVTGSSDFRGNIISNTGVQSVNVNGVGSLLNAQIAHYDDFADARAFVPSFKLTSVRSPITNPIHDIGTVNVTGKGGIIGSYFGAQHVGTIQSGGFGIFDSNVVLVGDGTLDHVTASGYGIRFGYIQGGSLFGNITAIGNGTNVPTTDFSANVRQSQNGGEFDPFTGLIFSPLNDINVALGVTSAPYQSLDVTKTGVIEDLTILADRNVGTVSAYEIRGRSIIIGGFDFELVSTFNIANQINTIQVAGPIDGLSLTTGRIRNFRTAGDVSGLTATFAGYVQKLVLNSNLDAGSTISVVGPNGRIGKVIIQGNMAGDISAITRIANITVNGSITGTIHANSIGTVHVHNGLANGMLTVDGAINTLIFDGDAGATGDTIQINGSMKMIKVGGNLAANVNVTANLGRLMVNGSILAGSTTTVGNVLTLLKVGQDIQAGAVVKAKVIKRQLIGGQLLGSIVTG